jgi:hypothetical protein
MSQRFPWDPNQPPGNSDPPIYIPRPNEPSEPSTPGFTIGMILIAVFGSCVIGFIGLAFFMVITGG